VMLTWATSCSSYVVSVLVRVSSREDRAAGCGARGRAPRWCGSGVPRLAAGRSAPRHRCGRAFDRAVRVDHDTLPGRSHDQQRTLAGEPRESSRTHSSVPNQAQFHPRFVEHPSIADVRPRGGPNLKDPEVFSDSGVNSAFARAHAARPPQHAEAERSEGHHPSSADAEQRRSTPKRRARRVVTGPATKEPGPRRPTGRRLPITRHTPLERRRPRARSGGVRDAGPTEEAQLGAATTRDPLRTCWSPSRR
jgi:hypothetical protein